MSETRKTITYAGVALLLLLVAFVTTPRRATPEDFVDQGESFFPDFTDPNVATTLEVVEFDEETAAARPFKVTFRDGRWTIPSHHNYPADGKDRLAQTAAGVIAVTKEDFRSSNVADHEACGVIDPLDETVTTLKGRGKRVTVKDASDQVLADLIIGDKVEGRTGLRFVRVPDQKSVYVTSTDLEISTKFADWIEPDLLQVASDDISDLTLKDYSIDERFRTVDQRDTLILTRKEDEWVANRMSSSQEVDSVKMNDLLRAVDELSIVGVRPKPEGLSQDLKRSEGSVPISQANLRSLQSKGYYFTRDGNLLSNEGELEVVTSDGLRYVLRFGEVLYGTGDAITAGSESSEQEESGPGENRYLFITAAFDESLLPEPAKPANTDFLNKPEEELSDADKKNKELQEAHDQWEEQIAEGQKLAEDLNARFADWYYVISADSFEKINLTRKDLVKKKES
jgi:hypothetical protein